MLGTDDEIWAELCGGYRLPYDPRPALDAIMSGVGAEAGWDELWQELHHQGDVDQASYAAVVILGHWEPEGPPDWNLFALASCIEVERHRKANPSVRPELRADYVASLDRLTDEALKALRTSRDPLVVQAALGMALGRGQLQLGALLGGLDDSSVEAYLEETMAWSELYDDVR